MLLQKFCKHVEMLEKTIFKEMLEHKKKVTNWIFYVWAIWYLFMLCIFTAAIALRPDQWTSPFVPTPLVFTFEIIVFVHMVVSLIFEVRDWISLGWRFYFACFRLFTVLSWFAFLTYFAAILFRFLQLKVRFASLCS